MAELHRGLAQRRLPGALAARSVRRGVVLPARADHRRALGVRRARLLGVLGGDEVAAERVVGVRAVLDLGLSEAVAYREALQRERGAFAPFLRLEHGETDGRDVVPGVRLACDEKVAALEFGVRVGKLVQELEHVRGDAFFVVHVIRRVRAVGEARADGLVDVNQVRHDVPAVLVDGERLAVGAHRVGAILGEQRQLGGAPRTAGHPQHHGRGTPGVVPGAEVEVEHFRRGRAVQLEVPR